MEGRSTDDVLVATGTTFADALAVAPLAGEHSGVALLVDGSGHGGHGGHHGHHGGHHGGHGGFHGHGHHWHGHYHVNNGCWRLTHHGWINVCIRY